MVDDVSNGAEWWRDAVVYQIYPRSFSDWDGDGIGDLKGIIAKVEYLTYLGIDAVWLSPFYPSAQVDGGYDIDDHRGVDPVFGTLEDFDVLASELHRRGIKLVVDIVPNHSSDRHVWFQEALNASRGSPARDRYIFRDGAGEDGAQPPSDWPSFFGGSAWTQVDDGQWYLHLFTREQPDWNWNNSEVREDFLETLRFWADHGADGFRVDVAHLAAKDLSGVLPSWNELVTASYAVGEHPLWDRDELDEIYRSWRKVFNSYDPPRAAVAEAWVPAERRVRFARPDTLGQAFNFDLLKAGWDRQQFKQIIDDNLQLSARSGGSSTWVLSNHDVVRHATRYGLSAGIDPVKWLLEGGPASDEDRGKGLRQARAATLLAMALPGSLYIYQGEELGLPEVGDLPKSAKLDPSYLRTGGADPGRDGCRVPLPWTAEGEFFGFSAGRAHLPQPDWFSQFAVASQRQDSNSTLNFYKSALELRRSIDPNAPLDWIELHNDTLAFSRAQDFVCITNFGDGSMTMPPGELLLTSVPLDDPSILPRYVTAWLRMERQDSRQ